MFYWKREGEVVRQGLGVYHPRDLHSIGFVLRIGNHIMLVRYSKFSKTLYKQYHKVDPEAYANWLKENKND